jgi:hypothetical protein
VPTPVRDYADLSKKEAQALFDAYVAAHPRWLEEFFAEVRRRGGPVELLDFSVESLLPLWEWVFANHRLPERPSSDQEMRASDPPYWYEFRPPVGQELGPDLSRFATLLGAYHAEIIFRAKPASRWVIGGGGKRAALFREPLLEIAGDGELPVTESAVYAMWRSLRGESDTTPQSLRDRIARWLVQIPPGPAAEAPPYSVEALTDEPGSERFDFEFAFDDAVAHEQEDRVAAFVARLGKAPGIVEAVHEDREIVLDRSPSLSVGTFEPIVARTWEEVGRPS